MLFTFAILSGKIKKINKHDSGSVCDCYSCFGILKSHNTDNSPQ